MVNSFAILEQSRVILSFVFAGQAGLVHCIVICITCNQPHILLIALSNQLWVTCWASFAVKWAAVTFSSDCSKFLFGFDSGKHSWRCQKWKHFQLSLHKCHVPYFFISFRKKVHKVFGTSSQYNYTQFHCLDLELWLLISKFVSKFCLGGLSLCSHTVII